MQNDNFCACFKYMYFMQALYYAYIRKTISLSCGANDVTNNSYEMQHIILATYMYYISKIVDLLDTVISAKRYQFHSKIKWPNLICIYRCSSFFAKRTIKSHFYMCIIMPVWFLQHSYTSNSSVVNTIYL